VNLRQNRPSVALGRLGSSQVKSGSCPLPKPPAEEGSRASECAVELGLADFPNDLTRMLYLASLRDCNSGRYLHPEISARMGIEVADQGLLACHDEVFRLLLVAPISRYVDQLDEYIRYTRMEMAVVLRTWQSLQAYRATVPMRASSLYREVFCLNVETALTILLSRLVEEHTRA